MKLGARILKTGIAITLALVLAKYLGSPSPIFAGIAAIFAIQPSIYRSYLTVLEQVQGNVIGALLAVVFVLIFGNNPFIIGLTAVIVIGINLKLKINNTIGLALVTVLSIMESTSDHFVLFALIRFSTILLGVLSAFAVNLIFLPPKYETKLYYKIVYTTEEIIKWIRISMRQATEYTLLKADISKIKDQIKRMDQFFDFYKEERTHSKKNRYVKSRKLVLFRQMIVTTNASYKILKLLHRLENDILHLPKNMQDLITSEIECLLGYHEHLMLKFIGKIKVQQTEPIADEVCTGRRALIHAFMQQRLQEEDSDNKAVYHLFPVVAAILEYSDHLDHLETLIDSFHSYHKDINEFKIEDEPELE